MLGRGHPWPHRLLKENLKGMGCSPCLGFGFGMLACSLLPVCTAAGRLVAELSLMFGWGGGCHTSGTTMTPTRRDPPSLHAAPRFHARSPFPGGSQPHSIFQGRHGKGRCSRREQAVLGAVPGEGKESGIPREQQQGRGQAATSPTLCEAPVMLRVPLYQRSRGSYVGAQPLVALGSSMSPTGCTHRVSITCIFAFRLLD